MPPNPFPTLKEWQAEKKKYGIPGKMIKGGNFGEKMEKLARAYDAKGGKAVNANNFGDVLQVLQQGETLADEWLAKAKTMKDSDFTNKKGAVDSVKNFKLRFEATTARVHQTVDPLHEPKIGLKKAMNLYRTATAEPSAENLMELWDNGVRQYVGQGFKIAVKNAATLGYSTALVNQLKAYDALVTKWMDTMLNGADAKKAAADMAVRDEFLNDMHKALSIATNILR